ncbi:MAG: response regulator [Acidobacteriota bacterium]
MLSNPNRARILVVDDEKFIADSLAAILQMKGYSAQAAYSAEEALPKAAAMAPDILISDVMMGPMNGVQLAQHIVSLHPGCGVFLISGNDDAAGLLESAGKQGLNFPLLAKPIHPDELLCLLEKDSN